LQAGRELFESICLTTTARRPGTIAIQSQHAGGKPEHKDDYRHEANLPSVSKSVVHNLLALVIVSVNRAERLIVCKLAVLILIQHHGLRGVSNQSCGLLACRLG